jgi:2-oxo-4-hydroxy-4-carboxy-5-ureidoimidazoline decarboxylase
MSSTDLAIQNEVPEEQATHRLAACNASPRWVNEMLKRRPYTDADSLLATAEQVARSLEWSEVCRALETHPRIGDRTTGPSMEAEWSRREQAVGRSDVTTQDALREGNAAYERRFGNVFLIRAAGRRAPETLVELRRRLGNDEASERGEVTEELAQITRLRLEKLLSE